MTRAHARLGAVPVPGGACRFLVWAPRAARVELWLTDGGDANAGRALDGGAPAAAAPIAGPARETSGPGLAMAGLPYAATLEPVGRGYHEAVVDDVAPGALYAYRLDDGPPRPDPASRSQPFGVHGPSEVLDPAFDWTDAGWTGIPLERHVFYELHVGAFTEAGTFDAVVGRLDALRELGVTTIELMPVAEFPGDRNWGYDGVCPFAVHRAYGGAAGLKRLVDACHRRGLAVALDVVYNHLGPAGNYLAEFGPYFTDRHRTPWGEALNFDGPDSGEVRRYFIENALYWIEEFHIDALRLDAVHAIVDQSATNVLEELAREAHALASVLGRRVHVIAESDLNDARLVRPRAAGGYGMDAQWADDFHHALHTLLTGERDGYYADYGRVRHLAEAFRHGFVYRGQYSEYRRRRHGNDPTGIPAYRFVVCAQNHDQIGNRMLGERLAELVPFSGLKLAAGAVLLSPYLPLLFMGEEYGDPARFPYFVSHTDPDLVDAVRRGRAEEFASFRWRGEPPDPQSEDTFRSARPDPSLADEGAPATLLRLHAELLRLRREVPALATPDNGRVEAVPYDAARALYVRRWAESSEAAALFHFGEAPAALTVPLPAGRWTKRLDSAALEWRGPGSALPADIESSGDVELRLEPLAFSLWLRGAAS